MIIAVNMKNFKFKIKGVYYMYKGFGMYDTDTNELLSFDGKEPYVLTKKYIIQGCIDGNWHETMKRVKAGA